MTISGETSSTILPTTNDAFDGEGGVCGNLRVGSEPGPPHRLFRISSIQEFRQRKVGVPEWAAQIKHELRKVSQKR